MLGVAEIGLMQRGTSFSRFLIIRKWTGAEWRAFRTCPHLLQTTYKRVDVEEVDSVQDLFTKGFKGKMSPGRFEVGRVSLPQTFVDSAERILRHENVKDLADKGEELERYLKARHLPIEDDEYRHKVEVVENEFKAKDSMMEPFLSQIQRVRMEQGREDRIRRRLKRIIYHWEPLEYNHARALQYLMSRTSAQYAALYRIFHELRARDSAFRPTSLFDFGSGLGSVSWAAWQFWSDSLVEQMCIDASKEMNDIAELLSKKGISTGNSVFPGLYFRQFLQSSHERKYNLTVSSYSLMDLPSAKSRIETVDILWRKTNKYLVLVEEGTNAGFEALNEARDYILKLDGEKAEQKLSQGHVFSPCPHEFTCPRYAIDNKTPCNFSVRYRPLYPFHQENTRKELFSYLVFKKGPRSGKDERWPRVVRDPILRHGHRICRLCTGTGQLAETVLTKSKHSNSLYRCAGKASTGDLLPVKERQVEKVAEASEEVSNSAAGAPSSTDVCTGTRPIASNLAEISHA